MKRTALVAFFAILISTSALAADVPQATDLTANFTNAGLNVADLRAFEIGGIVVLRGSTNDKSLAEAAGLYATNLGYNRVANLIRVIEAPDDRAIERRAERTLSMHRALDGCSFQIDSDQGVVHVAGRVRHELQKDVAMQLLRSIDGIREIKTDLNRF
ncbi:MAG TPA: BON domain-containing protein [Thermoanaerobaculia bacterium]|jgi:osmotically-inducible protein OsmY